MAAKKAIAGFIMIAPNRVRVVAPSTDRRTTGMDRFAFSRPNAAIQLRL
jgi:hypothetical protein